MAARGEEAERFAQVEAELLEALADADGQGEALEVPCAPEAGPRLVSFFRRGSPTCAPFLPRARAAEPPPRSQTLQATAARLSTRAEARAAELGARLARAARRAALCAWLHRARRVRHGARVVLVCAAARAARAGARPPPLAPAGTAALSRAAAGVRRERAARAAQLRAAASLAFLAVALQVRTRACERDATCPISTEGWTRRVHFVREGGGPSGRTAFALEPGSTPNASRARLGAAARGGAAARARRAEAARRLARARRAARVARRALRWRRCAPPGGAARSSWPRSAPARPRPRLTPGL